MRGLAIAGSILAAGISLSACTGMVDSGSTSMAASASGSHQGEANQIPGPTKNDIDQGGTQGPDGGFWEVYARQSDEGFAGAEESMNTINAYFNTDPAELVGADKYAKDVYQGFDCHLSTVQETGAQAVDCFDDQNISIIATTQAG
ncbi:MAG: hypothetical protein IJH84_19580 [Saccharopolyspora sp.]|uniref:hypothetical protein n=1 Tax=Saccharopolyspora TaxID=1835 RepID=UPI00190987E4|nr:MULTISPECIES: hypothetical protein [unclassified Saccharopolyspora]MBK0865572.1 hypothetical protein [Saccharopolyspora sp. HNM0986]MBQ6643217.1 hypothetical protein [Saccharopolyspora sp.]